MSKDKERQMERYKEEIKPHLPLSEIYEEKLKSMGSIGNHITGLNHFVDFLDKYEDQVDVKNMKANQFQWWYTYLSNRVADSTSKNYFYAAIKYLRYTGLIDETEYENSSEDTYEKFRNIQTEKEKVAQEKNLDLWFSREQMEKMCDVADIYRDEILVKFLYHTGARATEATHTLVEDVDLVERSVQITTAKRDDNHTRTIYYPSDFADPMREWVQTARHNYMYSDSSDYLLLGRASKQLDENWVRNKIVELAEKAGFQRVLYTDSNDSRQFMYTTHEFRRGYIMRHLDAQMPTPYLKEIVGHRDLSTTEKYISKADSVLENAQKTYRPD